MLQEHWLSVGEKRNINKREAGLIFTHWFQETEEYVQGDGGSVWKQ